MKQKNKLLAEFLIENYIFMTKFKEFIEGNHFTIIDSNLIDEIMNLCETVISEANFLGFYQYEELLKQLNQKLLELNDQNIQSEAEILFSIPELYTQIKLLSKYIETNNIEPFSNICVSRKNQKSKNSEAGIRQVLKNKAS